MLRTWLAKEVIAMSPIHIPPEWDDNDVLYFEEFCTFVRTPQRTARDWKRSESADSDAAMKQRR